MREFLSIKRKLRIESRVDTQPIWQKRKTCKKRESEFTRNFLKLSLFEKKDWKIQKKISWNHEMIWRAQKSFLYPNISLSFSSILSIAEVSYYVNYSVKNSTVDCKYLLYFLWVSRCFFKQSAILAFFVLFWF